MLLMFSKYESYSLIKDFSKCCNSPKQSQFILKMQINKCYLYCLNIFCLILFKFLILIYRLIYQLIHRLLKTRNMCLPITHCVFVLPHVLERDSKIFDHNIHLTNTYNTLYIINILDFVYKLEMCCFGLAEHVKKSA